LQLCAALRARVASVLGGSAVVLNRDCNEVAPLLVERSRERGAHLLVFADNEGLDARWRAVESLLRAGCDLLINFPTSSLKRVLGAARRGDGKSVRALTEFFGCDEWRGAGGGDELLELYAGRLATRYWEQRGKGPFVSSIRVGCKRFYYDVLLVCKWGPYVEAWDYLRKRLEWRDPEIVSYTLDLLRGRAQRADWLSGLRDAVEGGGRRARPWTASSSSPEARTHSCGCQKEKGRDRAR